MAKEKAKKVEKQENLPRQAPLQQKQPANSTHEKEREIVIRALRKRMKAGAPKLFVTYDDLFRFAIVYVFDTFDNFKRLRLSLLKRPGDEPPKARGYCMTGRAVDSIGVNMALVWVSNETSLKDAAPTLVHEITHVAQDILETVGVQDKNGEALAYLVEREYARVVRGFIGEKVDEAFAGETVIKAVYDTLGKEAPNGAK